MGKLLILFGLSLAVIGVILTLPIRIPWFGRLPGDLMIKKENLIFYFPLTTCILVSVVLTVFLRFFKK